MKTIPHFQQAYETVGNWKIAEDESISIEVSDMHNEDYAFLVAIHEAIEVWLCRKRSITEESVTAFDINFEGRRLHGDTSEPGDDPNAPYRKEHFFATTVERMIAAELGVDWKTYDDTVTSL
jgi:hypothetical protein